MGGSQASERERESFAQGPGNALQKMPESCVCTNHWGSVSSSPFSLGLILGTAQVSLWGPPLNLMRKKKPTRERMDRARGDKRSCVQKMQKDNLISLTWNEKSLAA